MYFDPLQGQLSRDLPQRLKNMFILHIQRKPKYMHGKLKRKYFFFHVIRSTLEGQYHHIYYAVWQAPLKIAAALGQCKSTFEQTPAKHVIVGAPWIGTSYCIMVDMLYRRSFEKNKVFPRIKH